MKVVDMHCDTISELFHRREMGKEYSLLKNDCHIDLERMKKGDYLLQNFALFTELTSHENPFEYCMQLLDLFYTEIIKYENLIQVVTCYDDIEKNRKEGKMSALLTIEEGEVCHGKLSYLRNFYRLGVRMMTLTWNYNNSLGSSNKRKEKNGESFFEPETEKGLTDKGIEFVNEMENLGMIIDISHLSDAGIKDVFLHTKKPLVASHSNARSVASHPRNLTDEMIRQLSERGGVTGINYYAHFLHDWKRNDEAISCMNHMIAHIKHMKQVGGIQCIGLGSDFDGIRGALEIGSPEDLPLLEGAMKQSGFTDKEIEAVFYKNVLRVYKEILH